MGRRARFAVDLVSVALLGSVLASTGCGSGEPVASPTITAQGFDLTQTRSVQVGERPELRLRIEAPAGLEGLFVGERSYEVDLAQSPEPAHFPLFGLSRRVWSKTDVTLDFGPYVAKKMTAPGEYGFAITVSDRKGQMAKADLRVAVLSEPEAEPEEVELDSEPPAAPADAAAPVETPAARAEPMRTREFRLERVGRGPVVASQDFGIRWETIESVHVVIRLSESSASGGEGSRFVRLEPDAFSGIETREQLAEVVGQMATRASLDLTTANDAAAGAVVAIVQPDRSYLLYADQSHTSLSDLGTTVTLTGRYKN